MRRRRRVADSLVTPRPSYSIQSFSVTCALVPLLLLPAPSPAGGDDPAHNCWRPREQPHTSEYADRARRPQPPYRTCVWCAARACPPPSDGDGQIRRPPERDGAPNREVRFPAKRTAGAHLTATAFDRRRRWIRTESSCRSGGLPARPGGAS
jgi:hypothetical protein